jgi:capsular polysaccharide biosynthesis protein
MENNNKIKQELSLTDLIQILFRNVWLILSFVATFFILSFLLAFYIITPDYKSRADVMVQVEQGSSSSSDPNFDLVNAFRLIDTVAELMQKEVVLENAIERLENLGYSDLTSSELRKGLSVSSSISSYFINIEFIHQDETFVVHVVDSLIEAVIEITDVEDAFPVLTNKIRRTSFATEAMYNSPNKILFIGLGIFVGLLLSITIAFTKELVSTRFRTKDEVESTLGLQVLGIIPMKTQKELSNGKK